MWKALRFQLNTIKIQLVKTEVGKTQIWAFDKLLMVLAISEISSKYLYLVHDISDEDDLQSLREKKPFILRGKRPFLLRGKRPFIMRGKRPFKLRGKRPFMLKGKRPFILRGKRPFLLGNPQFFEDTKRAPEGKKCVIWNHTLAYSAWYDVKYYNDFKWKCKTKVDK